MEPQPHQTEKLPSIKTQDNPEIKEQPSESANLEIEKLWKNFNQLNNTVYVAVIALLISFIVLLIAIGTILVDVWLAKQQSYQDLQTQIYQLNANKRR